MNKKRQSSHATETSNSKEAEHENKINVLEQEVIQMKSQMCTGAGAASEVKPKGTLFDAKKFWKG